MKNGLPRLLREDILVEYLDHPDKTEGGLHIPATASKDAYTKGLVLAIGPKVYDIEVGDTVYSFGKKAGLAYKSYYIVHQKNCFAKEEY